ncbi:hypothetical protein EYZ11_013257 [Aspergillus tanneri]|uniref:Uncharacterized protein n=1 Tax=Aspergillus tanneri TaxID=1220188 RepID=A0A4S3IY43_9EURO|nr:hypothetical protein EYZ11_013257 [Aspergillus tanneri]
MIPKSLYLPAYLFAALAAALPQGSSSSGPQSPASLGITKQEITTGGRKPATVFGSVVKFDDNVDITKPQLVGMAQAAYQEMISLWKSELAERPPVMTALKVGNEVILSSSMKGGATYIYQSQELINDDKKGKDDKVEKGFGAFTNVLKQNAPDVMEALDKCREESRRLEGIKNKDQSGNGESGSSSNPNTGQGAWSTVGGQKGKGKDQNGSKKGTPKVKNNKDTTYQHRRDGVCGEVLASLRYRMEHSGPNNRLDKKDPQPVVVAWLRLGLWRFYWFQGNGL